jgi:hypothetical protein
LSCFNPAEIQPFSIYEGAIWNPSNRMSNCSTLFGANINSSSLARLSIALSFDEIFKNPKTLSTARI